MVHHRVHRTWRGADRRETLDIFVDAVEEVRAAAPDVEAVGFGIPALVEWETGVSRWSNHLPLDDVPFRDLMSERLGLPVVVDNDGNASMLAEARAGAASAARHAVMVALGTGIGGGLLLDGRGVPGRARARAGAGPRGARAARAGLPWRLPRARLLRGARVGDRDRARGRAVAAERPDSALGRRLAAGNEISGGIVTELAHGGDQAAREVLAEIGRRLGFGLVGVVNAFNPEVVVIGGGAVRGGRAAARAGARGGGARMRCRRRGRASGSCRPTSATRRGCWARR